MSTTTTTAATRPTTRSTLRQTLGLSSMGKAFADAMHSKEEKPKRGRTAKEKEQEKEAAREKADSESSSARRTQPAPVASRSTARPSTSERERPAGPSALAPPAKDPAPERAATIGRRMMTRSQRVLAASSTSTAEDSSPTSVRPTLSEVSIPASLSPALEKSRAGALRSRTHAPSASASATGSSGLPKFRPRSVVVDPVSKASPARPSTRRRLSDSEDSILDDSSSASPDSSDRHRPISPLPKRAAFQVNLNATNKTAAATPPVSMRVKDPAQVPRSQSPARPPSKLAKKGPPASTGSSLVRSPSAASTSAVRIKPATTTPRSVRSVFGFGKTTPVASDAPPTTDSAKRSSIQAPRRTASPLRPPRDPSPTSERQRPPRSTKPIASPPLSDAGSTPTATPFRPDPGNDSFDVNMMLSMASPSAPTPAVMPRIVVGSGSRLADPETPTRGARGHAPPLQLLMTPDGSPSYLRPDSGKRGATRDRGSLTLEQLAAQGSHALAPGEDRMLSEILAPFASRSASGALSPTFGPLELPGSPGLPGGLALFSPGQSLAQVVLPDMTPSPAPRRELYDALPPPPSAEAVMLRLQVAQAEGVARERLQTVQTLETELAQAHDARERERREAAERVAHLEEQLRSSLHVREQVQAAEAGRVAALEAELAHAHAARKREAGAAAQRGVQRERARMHAANSADAAAARWAMVKEGADAERALVATNKETLAVFLGMLDQTLAQLRTASA